MKPVFIALFIKICLLSSLPAQDNHYESNQVGSKNAILSGASLSRWVDQTAVINNAATMIFAKETGFTLNTATASFEDILFQNALGEGFNLESSSLLVFPGFIALEIPSLQRKGKRAVGLSVFGRNHDRLRFTNRVTLSHNIIEGEESPGQEQFTGLYSFDNDSDETAIAMGWAERLSDEWAFGFATQVFFRNQKYQETFSATVITNPSANAEEDVIRSESGVNVKYSATLLQFKGSLAWQNAGWSAGLTITAPTIGIWSEGSMLAQIGLINMRVSPDSARGSYFANAYLPQSKVRYKYPLAIEGGVSKQIENVQISVAASWHAPLKRYLVMDPAAATEFQPDGEANALYDPRLFEVWSINRAVTNFMTSAVWQISDATGLLFGFRTDYHFSEFPDAEENVPGFHLNKKIWNRYHFSSGAEIRYRRSLWIVGIAYSMGAEDNYPSPYRLTGVNEGNFLQGDYGTGSIRQKGLSFVLSFFFQFQQREG